MSEHFILIGTYGWQHPRWDEVYYPEELPIEWKIGYYGNEYPVVMVPQSYWVQAPDQDAPDSGQYAQWLEESDDALQFLCEWPASGASEEAYARAQQGISVLKERVMAVLIPITAMPTEHEWSHIRAMAQNERLSFDIQPDFREAVIAELAIQLPEQDYGICWHGEPDNAKDIKHGTVGVCRSAENLDPRALRSLFETMLAACDDSRKMAFIVDGSPPPLTLLANAGIILDLL